MMRDKRDGRDAVVIEPYQCEWCDGGWHVGHVVGVLRQVKPYRREKVKVDDDGE